MDYYKTNLNIILILGLTMYAHFVSCDVQYSCNSTSICETICSCFPINDNKPDFDELTMECTNVTIANETFFPCLDTRIFNLHIYGSDLTHLKPQDMNKMTNLQTFKLGDSTQLVTIEEGAFDGLPALTEIHIENTALNNLSPQAFKSLTHLSTLVMKKGNLTVLSKEHFISLTQSLINLDLSQNKINNFIGGILTNKTNSLVYFNISFNQLQTIEDDLLGHLEFLERLDMSHNVIASAEANAFVDLIVLKNLYLHNNQLFELPESLFNVEILNLSYNHFDDVPKYGFNVNYHLQYLNMDGNLLQKLQNQSFHELTYLKELHLSHMPTLSSVEDGAFAELRQIERIYMYNNSALETIEAQAFPPEVAVHLEYFHIHNNSLAYLPSEMFTNTSFLPALKEVHAYGNPFNCSCDVAWMRDVMDDEAITWAHEWKQGDTAVKCANPERFNNTEIYHYTLDDLTCELPQVLHKEQFEETNNVEYYMQVWIHKGLPSTNWTIPNGKTLKDGEVDDPKDGRDIVTVTEKVLANGTVVTRVTIEYPSVNSAGKYTMQATNAVGNKKVEFEAKPPQSSPSDDIKYIGLIVGSVIGAIILLVVFVVVVRFIRARPPTYKRMEEPTGVPKDPGSLPSSRNDAGGDNEQGPFMVSGQSSSYGGVTNTNVPATQPQPQESPAVV